MHFMVTAFHTAVHRVKKAAAILIRELIEGEVLFCFVLFCFVLFYLGEKAPEKVCFFR